MKKLIKKRVSLIKAKRTKSTKQKRTTIKYSTAKNIPISDSLRKTLSRKSTCYDYNNQKHIDNIRIAETLVTKHNIDLSKYVHRSTGQYRQGIKLSFYDGLNFFTIQINLLANAIRQYKFYLNDEIIVNETFESSLTIKLDNNIDDEL